MADVADDPRPAAHLSDGRTRPRRFDSSPLVRSLRSAATDLASRPAALDRAGQELIMKEAVSVEPPPALDEIPILVELDKTE